jgi:hypothetical protein
MKLDINLATLKPSELIRLALEEARIVEASPTNWLCMDLWVHDFGSYCKVCLAGAIMLRHTKYPSGVKRSVQPTDYDGNTLRRLIAIDKFREGKIEDGLELCGVTSLKMEAACPKMEKPMSDAWVFFQPYDEPEEDEDGELDHDHVFAFMEEIASILETEDL